MNEPKQSIWEKSWDFETPMRQFSKRLGERMLRFLRVFTLRRVVFAMACLITLVALFYSVENWRGKTAWGKRKKEMAAKGVNLDWDSYVATNQHLKVHADAEKSRLLRQLLQKQTVMVMPPKPVLVTAPFRQIVNSLKEYPPAFEVLAALPERTTNSISLQKLVIWGGTNVVVQLEKYVVLDYHDSLQDLARVSGFKLVNGDPKKIYFGDRGLHEKILPELKGKGSLEVLITLLKAEGLTVTGEAGRQEIEIELDVSRDTLRTWFELNRPWMEELFAALRQEGMKLDNDPRNFSMTVVQNLVAARSLAQTFATGVKLEVLDGRPDRVRFYLEAQESLMEFLSEPPHSLVSAMVKVSMAGLHADAIEDGLRERVFRQADLRRLRANLEKFNLLADVIQAWGEWEVLSYVYAFENMSRDYWVEALAGDPEEGESSFRIYLKYAPKGWYLQNLLRLERNSESLLRAVNVSGRRFDAEAVDAFTNELKEERLKWPGPYEWIERTTFPNLQRAFQLVAFNQSRLHMLIVASALEEYRLDKGEYPLKLEDLVPEYLDRIPNDVIDGSPFRYRLETKDSFVLYSIGWNRKDEGAFVKAEKVPFSVSKLGLTVYSKDRTQGDWVFRSKPPARE